MYTDIHTEFIQTPIQTILEEGINASHSLIFGIESFPMSEYYLQSLFLRMTGAAEQKMKCILWQMATNDYQYRNKYLNYQGLGECSTYSSKNTVFKDLVTQITNIKPDFNIQSIWDDYIYDPAVVAEERSKWESKELGSRQKKIDSIIKKSIDKGNPMTSDEIDKMKNGIMNRPFNEDNFNNHLSANKRSSRVAQILEDVLKLSVNTSLESWRNVDLLNYKKRCQKNIKGSDVATRNKDGVNLLSGNLVKLYNDLVYLQRNRIAHNTVSYQQNLPALDTLSSEDYYLHNYFFRFAIILIVDEVFMRLYKAYLLATKEKNYN